MNTESFTYALCRLFNGHKVSRKDWKDNSYLIYDKDLKIILHKKDNSISEYIPTNNDLYNYSWIGK